MPLHDQDRDYEIVPTRDGYDRWSAIYDEMDNALITLEEPVVDDLLGDIGGLDVADIGCGTGRHAVRLAARGAHVVGLDFSRGMLDRARAKPGAESVRWIEHDLTEPLPLADGCVTRVLSSLVLEHISDLTPLYREMRRICRPGGRAIITCMHPAMMLRGVLAHFTDPATGREVQPQSRPHETTDFVMAALDAGWRLTHLSEHAVDETLVARSPSMVKYLRWPLLLALAFE